MFCILEFDDGGEEIMFSLCIDMWWFDVNGLGVMWFDMWLVMWFVFVCLNVIVWFLIDWFEW